MRRICRVHNVLVRVAALGYLGASAVALYHDEFIAAGLLAGLAAWNYRLGDV